MQTVLLTGANRGIGLEFARQYAAEGWRVIATCRAPGGADELNALPGQIEVRGLDVSDFQAVDRLARELEGEAIDLLLNNAGISGPRPGHLGNIDYEGWPDVFWTNSLAPLRMAESFLPHIERSGRRLIVSLTSRLGSIGDNSGGGDYLYRSSKAALNSNMKGLAMDLAPRGVTVVVMHPGWVRTDMGGPHAPLEVAESVASIRAVIDGLEPACAGRFLDYDGTEAPW
ncbi:MAG: SDR family oxidoreductase [Rhodospirillales bacterium]|jgi:NAD(P)-dependent dehydrogenase (short-subunit alcohol dehydrogenase family)|nr:SDR family oxidoreductase [Rhodospirillales bacterium]